MAKTAGREFAVKKGGTLIGSVRTKSVTSNDTPIETTNDDDSGFVSYLNDVFATRALEISVEGLTDDDVLSDIAMSATDADSFLDDLTLERGSGEAIIGDFILTNYAETGQYQDATTFTATFVRNTTFETIINCDFTTLDPLNDTTLFAATGDLWSGANIAGASSTRGAAGTLGVDQTYEFFVDGADGTIEKASLVDDITAGTTGAVNALVAGDRLDIRMEIKVDGYGFTFFDFEQSVMTTTSGDLNNNGVRVAIDQLGEWEVIYSELSSAYVNADQNPDATPMPRSGVVASLPADDTDYDHVLNTTNGLYYRWDGSVWKTTSDDGFREIRIFVDLNTNSTGRVRVWNETELVLDHNHPTMFNAADILASDGVTITGTPEIDKLEMGLSALYNSISDSRTMNVRNFTAKVIRA